MYGLRCTSVRLHVFFGTLWFGGVMFSNFVVVPAANRIDPSHANPFLLAYGKAADLYMLPMGALTIIFGIIIGFPLHAWAAIGQPYGNTYLAALILALAVYLWGVLMVGRNIKKAMRSGLGSPEFTIIINKVKKYAATELLGFLAIFVMMVVLTAH